MKIYPSILTAIILTLSMPAAAEEDSRGILRNYLKERMLEKLESKTPPIVNALLTDPITRAGDYYFQIHPDIITRMYHVHVPAGYHSTKPTPLLIALHGGGGDMEYMARDDYYGLISKSDKEGFILVFPNGYSKFKSGKFATWNAGHCCGDARDKNIDDVHFIHDMIRHLTAQMKIDKTKIFVTGMSNGGMMAHRLACEMPETIKAIASIAGTDNTVECHPSRPISVLHIHAVNDTHVLFNGGAGEGSFKDPSKVTDFTSVPETIARWVKRNDCAPTPKRVLDVKGAFCDLYDGCAGGTQVKLCVTETGQHSWPGGHKPRGETPSQAISANDEMWSFFMGVR